MSDLNLISDKAAEELHDGKKHLSLGVAKLDLDYDTEAEFVRRYNKLIAEAIAEAQTE
jgi:hypothetical protein